MMSKAMCGIHKIAWVLLMVGGLNWLLVGLTGSDLFMYLGMGMTGWLARVVYILVGVSALSMLGLGKCCVKGMCGCGTNGCMGDHKAPMMPPAAK